MTEVGIVFMVVVTLMCYLFHVSTIVLVVLVVQMFMLLAELLMSQSAFTLLPLTYSYIVASLLPHVHHSCYNSCRYACT